MRRLLLARLSVPAVLALAAALLLPAAPASAARTAPGTLVVHLVPVSGHPDPAGIGITTGGRAIGDGIHGTTDATGTVTLHGLITDGTDYFAAITSVPAAGSATFAKADVEGIVPIPDGTVTVSLPLAVGGTITGRLVDHTGAPLAGVAVTAEQPGLLPLLTATTTSAGAYSFTGVTGGVIDLAVFPQASTGGAVDAVTRDEWLARSVAQTTSAPAATTAVPTRLVHSHYDLEAGLETARTWLPVSGATIRARNVVTGATYDERTDFTVSPQHQVLWDVPSGTYTLELITKAAPGHPVEDWWFPPLIDTDLTKDAAGAGQYPVVYDSEFHYQYVNGYLAR